MSSKAQKADPKSLKAFLSSLTSSVLMFCVCSFVFAFTYRSHKLRYILCPRLEAFSSLQTQPLQSHSLSSIRQIFTPQECLWSDCGLEAVLFLRYLKLLRNTFALAGLVIIPSLGCFNYFVGRAGPDDALNRLTWASVSPKSNLAYWLYVLYDTIFLTFVLFMISREAHRVQRLINQQSRTQEHAPSVTATHYLVAVQKLPQRLHDTTKLFEHLKEWTSQIESIRPLTTNDLEKKRLTELRTITAREIERRSTLTLQEAVKSGKLRDNKEPHRLGQVFLSWWCRLCESLLPTRYHTKLCSTVDLFRLMAKLDAQSRSMVQKLDASQHLATILHVKNLRAARAIVQAGLSDNLQFLRLRLIGAEANLVPCGLAASWTTFQLRSSATQAIVLILIVLWSIPTGASGALAQLSTLLRLAGLDPVSPALDTFIGLIQGVAPAILTSILLALFPPVLRQCLQWAQGPKLVEMELKEQSYLFWFDFSQLFLTTSISGSLPVVLDLIRNGVENLMLTLARNLPLASNYYLSYTLIQAIMTASGLLCRPEAYFRHFWSPLPLCSPHDQLGRLRELLFNVRWGGLYPRYTCIGVITIIYSLLNPLILCTSAVYFGLVGLTFQYVFLYVSDITHDSRGVFFFRALFKLFVGVYVMQLTLAGLFILKMSRDNLGHDVSQLIVILVQTLLTIQVEHFLRSKYVMLLRSEDLREIIRPIDHKYAQHSSQGNGEIWLPRDQYGFATTLAERIRHRIGVQARAIQVSTDQAVLLDSGKIVLTMHG